MIKLRKEIRRYIIKRYLRGLYKEGVPKTVRAIFIGDYVSNKILLDGIYEGRELNALDQLVFCHLPRDSVALDIGANIGNHTAYFARYFSRVIAFEPNPMVFAVLSANVVAIGGGVEIINVGLSDKTGNVYFQTNESNLGASRISDKPTPHKVDVSTLDVFIDSLSLAHCKFIKIDVEGHEYNVISGAKKLLQSCHPIIAMEGFYKAHPENGDRMQVLMQSLGYAFFFRLTDRKEGESDFSYAITPKYFRRGRKLRLEKVERLSNEDFGLLICSSINILAAGRPS